MIVYLSSFATEGEEGFQYRSNYLNRLIAQCKAQGHIDTTRFIYGWNDLVTTSLYQANKKWFTREYHLGMWSWKAYFILSALTRMKTDDLLIFLDSDLSVTGLLSDFYPVVLDHKAVFIGHGFRNDRFTTGDAFYLMGCNKEQYYSADHIWGAALFLLKCPTVVDFVRDWLVYSLNEEVLLSQNKYELNRPGFESTRYTQGPLTNLAVQYNFKILPNSWADHFAHPAIPLPLGGRS
jgi:hypothetical protein